MANRAATPRTPRRAGLPAVILALAAGIAIGVLASRGWPARGTGAPAGLAAAAPPATAATDAMPSPALPPPGALPPEAERYPEHFRDLEGKEPEEIPPVADLPVLEKLVREPLSAVPHRVIGAWDDARQSTSPGRRRAFVLVVDPRASDAEIEALARDVLARHGDSGILDVRIYDDEAATKQARALDGGRLAFRHLVGEVKRNDSLGIESIRVRGQRLEL